MIIKNLGNNKLVFLLLLTLVTILQSLQDLRIFQNQFF